MSNANPNQMIYMRHSDFGKPAGPVTQAAFDAVYSAKGFVAIDKKEYDSINARLATDAERARRVPAPAAAPAPAPRPAAAPSDKGSSEAK